MSQSLCSIRDIDSFPPQHKSPRGDMLREHYRLVGQTLNTSEAVSFKAGVPWIWPGPEVRSMARAYEGPVENFIRVSLVSVQTGTLELYCEDLADAPYGTDISDSLFIRRLSFWEQFGLSFLLAFFALLLSLFIGVYSEAPTSTLIPAALAVASIVFAATISYCVESHRRYSFHSLLYNEILRRKGLNQQNSRTVPIMPVETKPLS